MAEHNVSLKATGSAKRKHNLMNIISSLHQNHDVSSVQPPPMQDDPKASRKNGIPTMDSTPSGDTPTPSFVSGPDMSVDGTNNNEDDTLSNVLNFLYQAASSKLHPTMFQEPCGELGDPPLLEMQSNSLKKSSVMQLMECVANCTPEVKSMLKKDVDVIFECRRCRGLFRALPNFIRHKKVYCKENETPANLVTRRKSSAGTEDVSFRPHSHGVQTHAAAPVRVEVSNIPMTSAAVRQKIIIPNFAPAPTPPPPRVAPNITVSRFNIANIDSHGRPPATKVMITKTGGFATLSKFNNPAIVAASSKEALQKQHLYPMSSSFSSSQGIRRPKPACPICNKEMAERKNVRRHLVRVHMLSVMESLKLMHSKNPTVAGAKAIAESEEFDREKMASLEALCEEILEIGDHRKIYVLPESYEITTTKCPVCSRVLCSKTNLKRHLLEAHNFVLRSEKKYLQLKLFSEKQESTTAPSLRTLRNLPPVQPTTHVISILGNDIRTDSDQPSHDTDSDTKRVAMNSPSASSENQSENRPQPQVEAENNEPEKTTHEINRTPTKKTELTKDNEPGGESAGPVKEATNEVQDQPARIDAVECKCLTCNKMFSRRQTLQSHMVSIHNWTKEQFGTVYDNSNMEVGSIEASKDSDENGDSDSSEVEEKPGVNGNGIKVEGTCENQKKSDDSESKSSQMTISNGVTCVKSEDNVGKSEEAFAPREENAEPPKKRPKLFELPRPGKDAGQGASEKLLAISKLAAANASNKITMGTISIPLVNLKVSLRDRTSLTANNCTVVTAASPVVSAQPFPSMSHLSPQNGVDLFRSEANEPSKRLILRRLVTTTPSTSTLPSTTTSTLSKTIFAVTLKQPTIGKAAESTPPQKTPQRPLKPPRSSPDVTSPKRTFDISKRMCYTCNKTFDSQVAVKRHLLEIHCFSIEDALAASYDCSDVSDRAQKEGRALGYDILLAKCLICNKYYFSRENLSKHMSKIHHLQPEDLRHLQGTSATKGDSQNDSVISVTAADSHVSEEKSPEPKQVKKSARIQANSQPSPALAKNVTSMQLTSTAMFSLVNGVWVISSETIAHALKVFPKECINPHALRCVKCKHKYKKAWDLKVHLLKHVRGLGLYACKYCPGPYRLVSCRSKDLQRHLRSKHNKGLCERDRAAFLSDCRVDNKALWTAYGLPAGKF